MSLRPFFALLLGLTLLCGGGVACDSSQGGDPPEEDDVSPPGIPTSLEATASSGTVELEWSPPSDDDLAGYNIYRSDEPFPNTASARRLNEETLEEEYYRDEDVQNGMTYVYRVAAVDTADNESALSTSAETTLFPSPPDSPDGS